MAMKNQKDGGNRNPMMPRPSYMWIYVLVAAFIIGYSLVGTESTDPVLSDWNTVDEMIRNGDCGVFGPRLLDCFFAVEERLFSLYRR